jgi:hypothetical protein
MSLQLAAQHLASKGRGPDTTLVHMAPGEVDSLQAIAKAHGGSLTVNPDTGLPEAGFLSSILPMIAGVGLTAMSGGALSPMMAGLITGGVTGAATGSLKKGLMAGLGAYGGAGIGGALAGMGATQASNAAATELAGTNANLMSQLGEGANAKDILMARGAQSAGPAMQALNANPVQMSMTDKMMAGVKGLGNEAGRDAFMQNIGGAQGLFKSGAAALSPLLMAQAGETAQRPADPPNRFEFDAGATGAGPSRDSSESTYFRPRLRQYAEGGSTGMTGQSDEYYRYLMGLAPAPRPYTPAPAATQASISPLVAASPTAARRDDTYSDSMAFDDPNNPQNPNAWGNLTPLQQATFYANNPGYSAVSKGVSNFFAGTIPGKIQAALDPKGTLERSLVVQGLNPATGLPPGLNLSTVPVSIQEGMMSGLDTVPTITDEQAAQMMADEINASLGMTPTAPAPAQTPDVVVGGPIDTSNPVGTNIGMIDANIGIDPSGFGGIDPGVAVDVAAATAAGIDAGIDPGEFARGGLSSLAAFANGGYNLGDYSDGGRLLRGPGDGVSDSIPASIADKRPARLADGEFVVPARIVSELGNGSTEAGARKLYAMMNRVQQNRRKSIGKGKVAVNSRSDRLLPA